MAQKPKIAQWLDRKFLEWQLAQGGSQTVAAFAEYLGVSRDMLNNWMNRGQVPRGENIEKLADRLGDEIYDLLGLEPPDPAIRAFKAILPYLSDEQKKKLLAEAEAMAARRRGSGSKPG